MKILCDNVPASMCDSLSEPRLPSSTKRLGPISGLKENRSIEIGKLAADYRDAKTMLAIGMTSKPEIGNVHEHLKMLKVPVPVPQNSEVVIKLVASSMHADEIYAAQGTALGRFFGPKAISESNPHILGSSVSGVVVATGGDVEDLCVGDDVIAIPNHLGETASWATYRSIERKWVMAKPAGLTHVEAAAVTMAACVAWGAIGFADIDSQSRCVVIGATGAIGVMVLQYLKSLGCHVTAVCSGTSRELAKRLGADEVVDYTESNFDDVALKSGSRFDAAFDCVGGREIESRAFRSLKTDGAFVTVVGPMMYIGEKRLPWLAFLKVIGHVGWRMISTRLKTGPRYTFSAKYPQLVIKEAMQNLLIHDIRMPIYKIIPFERAAITDAVCLLPTHRVKGRIVIDFGLS